MWSSLQETANLVTLLEKSLMKNFIFCAVSFSKLNKNKNIISGIEFYREKGWSLEVVDRNISLDKISII